MNSLKSLKRLLPLCLATAVLSGNFTVGSVSAETVRILFTNNSNGKLADCNCVNDPYGGLAERVALIREYKEYYNSFILLDSGGYLGLSEMPKRGESVLRLMDIMGYETVGIGDQELYRGLGRFFDRYGDYKNRIVNATILTTDGKPAFAPYRVVDNNGVKIGITGIASAETFRFSPKESKDFITVDPDSALLKLLPEMKKKCDFVVVLSQLGREGDIKLAERRSGIDLIIGGHSQTLLEKTIRVGDCHIVQAGKNGGHVGEIVIRFDEMKKPGDVSYKLLEVTGRYSIPPDIVTLLTEEYGIEMR